MAPPMARSGDGYERGWNESPKQFIEKLRREKFNVGTGAANKLARDLHRTIRQLSVELYQNDFHFIKEIVQNAEDNSYAGDVSPSLEFQLINEDLAGVGAFTTLVILNNELGLRTEDVVALCSAGQSTKLGKRNDGLIGCKGIGFKSVFVICETPMMISNGYRIRFRAAATREARVGYIVPEWVESPSDERIMSAIGRDKLPTTVTILPIKEAKVQLVQKQLKEISPEIILFLTRIRELNVVDKTKKAVHSVDSLRITRSKPVFAISNDVWKFSEVTLSVRSSEGTISGTFPYFIFQQSYDVTHSVEERKEVREWTVTLAFPKQGRPSSGQVGDVFSFLPTELRTGFPFVINADFLLTTSRETIRFDSPWNVAILDCIPAAFELSFKIMVGVSRPRYNSRMAEVYPRWDCRDGYKFLPYSTVWDSYRYNSSSGNDARQVRQKLSVNPKDAANLHQVDNVRTRIFRRLEQNRLVRRCNLCVSDCNTAHYRSARQSIRIISSFHEILKRAALRHYPSPSVLSMRTEGSTSPGTGFAIVDEYVQTNYASGLEALGVPEMTPTQYVSFLRDSEWLLSLPENLYLQVLTFYADKLTIPQGSTAAGELRAIEYLKFRGELGKVQLGSFSGFSGSELIYNSSEGDADWIFSWAKAFEPWYPIRVMPTETAKALKEARNRELITWISKHGSLTELSVERYAEKLMEKLVVLKPKSNPVDKSLLILVSQFLYSGIDKGLLSFTRVIQTLQSRGHVNGVENVGWTTRTVSLKLKDEGGVVLPRSASKWPLLFSFSGHNQSQYFTELCDEYLDPQCSLVQDVVTRSSGPDSMLQFLKCVFNAVDIPNVKLPANADLPFHHPVTLEKSLLLFQWLKTFLPSRTLTKSERENDRLLTSLKALEWVKTCHHGWQRPTCVFFPTSHLENHFSANDLPLLDVSAYSLDLDSYETRVVLAELGVVTDMRKGCAVAQYFFSRTAERLDLAAVERFYSYLNEVEWEADEDKLRVVESARVWTPPSGTRSQPMWRAPSKCIICDELDVFKNWDDVFVLYDYYDESLVSFFSGKLRVPENASIELYRRIWLNWSNSYSVIKEEKPVLQCLSLAKVQSVWTHLLEDWQECSKEDRESFCSSARVPVASLSNPESVGETISLVSPDRALIADDLALAKSFSEAADGNLNIAWMWPDLSGKRADSLLKLYSEMGVRKLSNLVRSKLHIPPNIRKKNVPWGKGLICEGLFRCVLAYLCKNGVQFERRRQIMAGLVSATEFTVSQPIEIHDTLNVEMLTSPATVTRVVHSHYDPHTRKLYYLKKDHALVKEDVAKRAFNASLVTMLSVGILSKYPKLVGGLTTLLKLLFDLGFAMKFVEYELQAQMLSICPEDEALLVEKLATRQPKQTRRSTRRSTG